MTDLVVTPEAIQKWLEFTGHSLYGGSSMSRIVKCPASVRETLKAGPKPTSIYAADGTWYHEQMFKYGQNYGSLSVSSVMEIISKEHDDYEKIGNMISAYEYVSALFNDHDKPLILLESDGSLASFGLPECLGSADVTIHSPRRIDVTDYKFGYGVTVYAPDNYQLISYLGQVLDSLFTQGVKIDFNTLRMVVHIVQPTIDHYDKWEVTHSVFMKMIGDMQLAVEESKTANPRYNPGVDQCRWCAGNLNCQARLDSMNDHALTIFNMSETPQTATKEQWAQFLKASAAVKDAASRIESWAIAELMAGRDFPGFKLVEGRSSRKFINPEESGKFLAARLGAKAYKPQEFITLSQAEKIMPQLKKDPAWQMLLHKAPGQPKLAYDTDPAPKYIPSGATNQLGMFADEIIDI